MPGEVTMWLTVLSAFPALAPQHHGAHTVLGEVLGVLDSGIRKPENFPPRANYR